MAEVASEINSRSHSQIDNRSAPAPVALHFFQQMTEREKTDADRYAATILNLTARSCASEMSGEGEASIGWEHSCDISSALPRIVDVPSSTVESLGHLLRDCDSIANTSELPTAVAELVSVCQERKNRLDAAEAMVQRLEGLTRTLIAVQQQQYEAISDQTSPAPTVTRGAVTSAVSSLTGTQLSRSSDPPADLHSSSLARSCVRRAQDPPERTPSLSSPTMEATSPFGLVQEVYLGLSVGSHDKGPVKRCDPPVHGLVQESRPEIPSEETSLRTTHGADAVQAIVAEVLMKLNSNTSPVNLGQFEHSQSTAKAVLQGQPAMEILVKDAQQKLVTNESIAHPNDWIIQRLKPPKLSQMGRLPSDNLKSVDVFEDPPASSHDKDARIEKESSQKKEESSLDAKPAARQDNNVAVPFVKAPAMDPPEAGQTIISLDSVCTSADSTPNPGWARKAASNLPANASSAGAYRISSARTPATAPQATEDTRVTPGSGHGTTRPASDLSVHPASTTGQNTWRSTPAASSQDVESALDSVEIRDERPRVTSDLLAHYSPSGELYVGRRTSVAPHRVISSALDTIETRDEPSRFAKVRSPVNMPGAYGIIAGRGISRQTAFRRLSLSEDIPARTANFTSDGEANIQEGGTASRPLPVRGLSRRGLSRRNLSQTSSRSLLSALAPDDSLVRAIHFVEDAEVNFLEGESAPTTTANTIPAGGIPIPTGPTLSRPGLSRGSSRISVRQVSARLVNNADDDANASEDNILHLTEAIIRLQQEMNRRDQAIPQAEVVETNCQCVIL